MSCHIEKVIDLEHYRHVLALNNKREEFIKTYMSKNYIRNMNSAKFWGRKLRVSKRKENANPMLQDKINRIFSFLRGKSGNILSLGIGNGAIEKKLNKYNKNLELYGIDISNYSVKNANRVIAGTFKQSSILNIPYRSSLFNYVLALDILEHVSPNSIFKAYSEINRVLAKNGTLIISVPLNEGLEDMLRKNKNPNAHIRIYTPAILKFELELAGFKTYKQIYLYAFKSFYGVKSLFTKMFPKIRKQNLIIVFAKK